MNKCIYEIRLINHLKDLTAHEILIDQLIQNGFSLSDIVEFNNGFEQGISLFAFSPSQLHKFKTRLKKVSLTSFDQKFIKLYKEDWETKWKEDFKPFFITKDVKIVPLAYKNKINLTKNKSIFIDTDVVFGSGLHPTTRLCAELISEKKHSFKTLFDIGIGTGILSLIGKSYGAQKIYGIDIDPKAIENTKANFKLNDVEAEYLKACDFTKFKKNILFDLVVANMISPDLITMKEKIINFVKPGYYLIVSGISSHNFKNFRKLFDSATLRCLRIKKSEGWCALMYKRL